MCFCCCFWFSICFFRGGVGPLAGFGFGSAWQLCGFKCGQHDELLQTHTHSRIHICSYKMKLYRHTNTMHILNDSRLCACVCLCVGVCTLNIKRSLGRLASCPSYQSSLIWANDDAQLARCAALLYFALLCACLGTRHYLRLSRTRERGTF